MYQTGGGQLSFVPGHLQSPDSYLFGSFHDNYLKMAAYDIDQMTLAAIPSGAKFASGYSTSDEEDSASVNAAYENGTSNDGGYSISRFDFQVVNEWPYDIKVTGNSNYYGNDAKLETCHRDPDNPSPKAGEEVLFICTTIEEDSAGKWIKFVSYKIDRATLTPSFVQVRHSAYSNPIS
jgi:hypothetical protein